MKLGQGAYGLVKRENGKAVKYFTKIRHQVREFVILSIFRNSENVVSIRDVDFDHMTITMDLYDRNLKEHVFKNNLDKDEKYFIICELAKGLNEMHSAHFSHADLKLDNVLVRLDEDGKVDELVLGDCGLSSYHKYAKIQYTGERYRDPVILYDGKHDIFSFGVCVYEIVTGKKLETRESNQVLWLVNKYINDPVYKKILVRIFGHRDKRPTITEVLYLLGCNTGPVREIPKLFDEPNADTQVIEFNETKGTVQEIFRYYGKKYSIARCNKAYIMMLYYIEKYNIVKSDYTAWITCLLFLSYHMFGTKNDCQFLEKTKIVDKYRTALSKIVNDKYFIYLMI